MATKKSTAKKDWNVNKDGSPRKERSPSIPMKVFATALNKGFRGEEAQTKMGGGESVVRMIDYNATATYLNDTLEFTPTENAIRGRLKKVNSTLKQEGSKYSFRFIRKGRGGSRGMTAGEVASMFGEGFKKGQ